MSLRDQLRRLDARRRGPRPDPSGAQPAPAPAAARGPVAPRGGPAGIAEPRDVSETTSGGVTVRRSRFALDQRHGHHVLGEVRDVCAARLGTIARCGGDLPVDGAVFLDTETSDLGGGASVYVFMVGMLFVEHGEAVVEQVLLRAPEDEAAFLDQVERSLGPRSHLVTFSGKSFDRHRLDDRFALWSQRRPLRERPHLDLCHVGRRLYVRRLPDVRLKTLERRVLGVHREHDLTGAECPEAWFDFLDGHDDGRMEQVFRHNLIDVLSLLTLTVRVDRAIDRPGDALEAARAGLLLEAAGDRERALPRLRQCLDALEPGTWRIDRDVTQAGLRLARLLRASEGPRAALQVLERLAQVCAADPEPALAAARLAERELRDKALALRFARETRMRLLAQGGGSRHADALEGVGRRIARLEGSA